MAINNRCGLLQSPLMCMLKKACTSQIHDGKGTINILLEAWKRGSCRVYLFLQRRATHGESSESSQHLFATLASTLSVVLCRCLAGELTSRYRMRLRMGLRLGLGRVFNDGAEHIKQVDNVIPSTSAKGAQFQEL